MKLLKILGQELKVRLSPSFLQNAACPAHLKFRYIDKVNERYVRMEAERGKAIHSAIADLLEYCRTHNQDIEDIENGMLREAVQKHLPHRILNEVGVVLEWLMLWRDRFKLPKNIHGIEDKIALDDEFDECAWEEGNYRGILDLSQVNGDHIIITDWKSQPYIVPQGEMDVPLGNTMAEQLTMYCWLAWKMYPHLRTFTVRVWYLRYGFYMETSRTEDDLAAFENALMIKERKIAEIENWDPQPGEHCQYCDYIHQCPIALDLSPGNPNIITQEQAVLAAQRVTVMEALTTTLKKGLKNYVNHNNDVRIADNWVYGYKHKESSSWDPGEVDEILRDHGHELAEVVNVDVKKMRKTIKVAAKENPTLEGALEDTRKTKHKTEFKGYRIGELESDQPGEAE